MADSTTNIDTVATSQSNKEVTVNGFMDAASHAATYGRRQSTCLALTWGYYGGRFGGVSVDNGTLLLTASATNYIVAHRTTGAVTASVSATNWNTLQTYAQLYIVTTSAIAITEYEDHRSGPYGIASMAVSVSNQIMIPIQVGDVSTTITTGTGKASIRMPQAMYLTNIRAGLDTASTSGAVTLDINDTGATILATKLTLDQDEKTSASAATAHVFVSEAQALADDTPITVDIDGAGTGAKGLTIWLYGLPGVGDPAWGQVVSALSLEGTNGGTTWTDAVTGGPTWSAGSSVATSTAQSVNGTFSAYAASSTYFGTTNQYLRSSTSANHDPTTAPWCLQFWVRASSVANTPLLVTIGTATTNRLNLYLNSGALTLYTETVAGGGANRINGGTLSTGTWYFVELSYDLTTFTVWLDGVSQGTSTTTVVPAGSCQIDLGNYAYSPSATNVLDGYMQRFRFTRGLVRRTAAYSRPAKPWVAY